MHVALLTPMTADGRLDAASLERLVERVTAGGIGAICPVGSTGEGPQLTRQLRAEVTAAARAAAPDAPVIAAPCALTISDAVEEIAQLATAGADAVLLAPPSYFPMTAIEVATYYQRVADETSVPIVVYNIPALTTVAIPPAVLGDLAAHPRIIGVKDSSHDLEYLQGAVYATDGADFAVLTGTDTMLVASLTIGAVGAIAASANLVPQLGRQIFEAWTSGDIDTALARQRRLFEIVQACRAPGTPAGWKAALALAGICESAMVPPANAIADAHLDELAARLRDLELLR